MKTRMEPRLPRMSSWKNFTPWIRTLDPCICGKYFVTGPSKLIPKFTHVNISSLKNYQGLILAGHFYWFGRFVPSTGILTWTALWEFYVSDFGGPISKFLKLLQGSRVRILGVNFNIFSCWPSWETRFKSGFHSSFWDFKGRIWKWGMASSFWNHVIQISVRQAYFHDIYSQLWIVKIFTENIYFLSSNTYFWGTIVYLQYCIAPVVWSFFIDYCTAIRDT